MSSLIHYKKAPIMITFPKMAHGETYIGMIGDSRRNLHHIIKLPGENIGAPHKDQIEWAKSMGGDLPGRIELNMIWESFGDLLEHEFYWTNEKHHNNSNYAWYQNFVSGRQDYASAVDTLYAVAILRIKA